MTRTFPAAALVLVFTTACSRPDASEHIANGDRYLAESQLSAAALEYRLALQADPQRGDARMKLADLAVRTGDGPTALREYVRAADLLPDDATAQLRAGELLLMSGSFEDAKSRASRLLEIDPKHVEGQILLGNALAGLKDFDSALTEYQEALALDPSAEEAYVNMGAVQVAQGDRASAEASFRRAADVAPRSVRARLALANFQWASGRAAEAEETLKAALALDPANQVANRALGIFYLASNRAAEAEPYFKTIALTAKTEGATLALADYYVALRRFDEARQVLGELAATESSFAVATTRLAAVDVAQGQRALALTRLREVTGKFPKNMPARLLAARVQFMDGSRDEALATARAIVQEEPTAAAATGAYLVIGQIEAGRERTAEAIRAHEEVIRRQPRSMAAALALAGLHLGARSPEKAATYARQALTIDRQYPPARALMARVMLAERKIAEARSEIAALQREFPDAPAVLNLVAARQMMDGQPDAARATYARVATAAPADLEALTGLTTLDVARGRATEAAARLDEALKSGPTANLLVLAARAHIAAGNPARAEALLTGAIDAEPDRLSAYGLLGHFYVSQRKVDTAMDQFREVLKRSPTDVAANTILGMLLELGQRYPEAEKHYQAALGANPDAAVAANNLAWRYVAGNRNLDEALRLAQTAQRVLPEEPNVNDTLGWIYYKRGVTTEAIRHLEMSVAKKTDDPMIFYHLGMAYFREGSLDRATAELRRALAFNRDFEGIAEAREALAKLGS